MSGIKAHDFNPDGTPKSLTTIGLMRGQCWWFICACGGRASQHVKGEDRAPRRACPRCGAEIKGGL